MASYLTTTLPQIAGTLLALDISTNFLNALPPVLAICGNLEELNVTNNPLRVLPMFLAALTNLRVFITDNTGIGTLPDSLADLQKLHTLSVRRNKMHALPSWLCLLPNLQTLCIDGNPFQGPWKALVEPLLAKIPITPMFALPTPLYPPHSAISQNSVFPDDEHTDVEDETDSSSVGVNGYPSPSPEEDEDTITAEHANMLNQSATSTYPANLPPPTSDHNRGLTRTRTTPNRTYFNQGRVKSSAPNVEIRTSKESTRGEHEIRKMKSAGELRRGRSATGASTPPRLPLSHYPTSVSTTNLAASPTTLDSPSSKRFATLASATGQVASSRSPNPARTQQTNSLWDSISESEDDAPYPGRASSATPNHSAPDNSPHQPHQQPLTDERLAIRQRSFKDNSKEKGRWGFLKKMSMGKIKPDSPVPALPQGLSRGAVPRTQTPTGQSTLGSSANKSPQIDIRFSTTGTLGPLSLASPNFHPSTSPLTLDKKPSQDLLKLPQASSPNLLAPPSPQPRSAKRRSFLPIPDAPATLKIPIPDSANFLLGLVAHNESEDTEVQDPTAGPVIDNEAYLRREEERAREAYMRALRSVMAYLKDMNDLGLSQLQSNSLSMYGGPDEATSTTTRSRRPTGVDGVREVSMALSGTETPPHLRSADAIAGLRSGSAAQTLSVATTDSVGSSEERKWKDDRSKRGMVVKEIVVYVLDHLSSGTSLIRLGIIFSTERTYVKGLQELVDIYIKPGTEPANLLSNVGSARDTVVPAAERKIVFGGLESLFSFHKDSFLPALESAAAPLLRTTEEVSNADVGGQLSLEVARAVAGMFLKHAAFMRMYSTYIK